MRRTLSWLLLCLFFGVVTYPAADFALWHMRQRFLPGYHDTRILCERRSLQTLTSAQEETPDLTLDTNEKLASAKECASLLGTLADYRQSIPKRSLFLSVVVFLATLIVRFVMFPLPSHRKT